MIYPSKKQAPLAKKKPADASVSDGDTLERPKNEKTPKAKTETKAQSDTSFKAENILKLENLSTNIQDKCVACGFQGRMDWQVTLHDGAWALLCDNCGLKLEKQLEEV